MKIVIDKDREYDFPDNDVAGTRNENKITELKIEVPEKYQNWNKRIVFITPDGKPWYYIENDTFTLTSEITKYGEVDAYIWLTEHANNQEESPGDFRSKIFTLTFNDNENTDNYEPSPEQVDGFNGLITVLNEELEVVRGIEGNIEQSEQSRAIAERQRAENENTRQSNETTRNNNEQTRQSQEESRERRTNEAISNIQDKTAEYNANATAKTNAFNQNSSQKTDDFNSNATQKTGDFDLNASNKTTSFNDNATSKTNTFNTNASNKTTDFNDNASTKTSTFNSNASDKTDTFNSNATSKTGDFNTNAEEKTEEFEQVVNEKIEEIEALNTLHIVSEEVIDL